MVSPSDGERILTQDIRRTYIQAEKDIISKVANFVKKGKDVPGWHKRKLAQLDQFTGEVQQEILEEQLGTVRDKKIREGVKKAYQKGQRSAVNALKEGGQDVAIAGRFGETDRRTVEALSRSLTQSLNNTHFRITREAEDVYRRVVGEGIRGHVAGGQSRIEASQRILNDFADQGIVGFTDRTGRNWSLSAYTEMATRTTAGQAALEGQVNRMKDNDHDLAIVGTSYEPCPICMPWEEVVLSISGENEDYPSLADAEGAGLFHPNCYSEDTEVYTDKGWKKFSNLEGSEKIFSLDPNTHIPEWVKYNKFIAYEYSGEMIEFKSNSFDLLVTPDHQMYAGFNSHKGDDKTVNWKLEDAEKCIDHNFRQIRAVEWEGEKKENQFNFDNKSFARLLGYYISEGYTERSQKHDRVIISQKANSDRSDKMYLDLKKIGFRRSKERIYKTDSKLTDYFEQFGHSYEKYLPDWIMENTSEVIEVFLDAFRLGDGSERITTHKDKDFESTEKTYFTSSKKLADQLGELIIKAGYYPSFHLRKDKGTIVEHQNGVYKGNHNIWIIRQNSTEFSHHNISPSISDYGIQSKPIYYEGMVYDVELEKNHILLVRRNGKIAWSGNCTHSLTPYIEGVTEKETEGKEEKADKAERYQEREQQRHNERQIRKWKKRKVGCMTEDECLKASQKIKEWQEKQRNFIDETGRYRKYNREQITGLE